MVHSFSHWLRSQDVSKPPTCPDLAAVFFPYLILCSRGCISCYQKTLRQIACLRIVWLNRMRRYAAYLMSYKGVTFLFSLGSPINFYVNYLLLWGRKNCLDNVITDVLSQSYLEYLFRGRKRVWQVSISFFISIKQRHLPLVWNILTDV